MSEVTPANWLACAKHAEDDVGALFVLRSWQRARTPEKRHVVAIEISGKDPATTTVVLRENEWGPGHCGYAPGLCDAVIRAFEDLAEHETDE